MRAVEIFAGAGGAAMGLHRAGIVTLARCEWDRDACATLRAAAEAGHLDTADVIEGDVRAVDWSPYVGMVDLLWASPPCQAWSSAGKRLGAADDRNGWPWTWDVADTLRPTWMVAENVTGLLMHRGDCDGKGAPEDCPACYFHRRILTEARKRFASVQWAVLNSSAYGVPQHRRRVYLVCGPRPIAWPRETHAGPAEIRQGGLFAAAVLPWRTVREALNLGGDLEVWGAGSRGHGMAEWRPREVSGTVSGTVSGMQGSTAGHYVLRPERGTGMQERHGVRRDHPTDEPAPQIGAGSKGSGPRQQIVYKRGRDGVVADEAHTTDEPACALRGSPGGSSQPFILDPKHPPTLPDSPATSIRSGGNGHSAPPMWLRTEMTGAVAADVEQPAATVPKSGNQYLHGRDPGVRNGPLDSPADTIAGGSQKAHTNGRSIVSTSKERRREYEEAGLRRLTVTECALLMSWPADYPLQGTKTSQYRQVGNGCTPPVVEAIARAATKAQS